MPKFNDSENILPHVPEGDYVFRVTGFNQAISAGGKTAGSVKYELECEVELKLGERGPKFYENLIDHEVTYWKLDCFVKSAGVQLSKGERYEFNRDDAKSAGVKFVDPIGLRGWCRLIVEEYPLNSGKRRNKVAVFYTNKPKLPPVRIESQDAPESEAF